VEAPFADMLSELLGNESAPPVEPISVPQEHSCEVESVLSELAGNAALFARLESIPSSNIVQTGEEPSKSEAELPVADPVMADIPLAVAHPAPRPQVFVPKPPPVMPEPASGADDLLAMLLESESGSVEEVVPEPQAEACPTLADIEPAVIVQAITPAKAADAGAGGDSCLAFSLAGVKFGIPIHQVVELDKLPRITPVPHVPDWVLGVTNLRGEILPVLDLRMLLGMAHGEPLERGRILVIRLGEDLTSALLVDEVGGIARYVKDRLTPPGPEEPEKVTPLLDGVYSSGELRLKILNMDRLMESAELRQLAEA
jgi:chemotaxis signal transduction protein